MKRQLHILAAAALMTATLYSAQAFAALDAQQSGATTAATASAAQDIQVASWDFIPTDPDSGE